MAMIEKIFIQYPFLRYVSAILIMAVLFHMSSKPGTDLPSLFYGSDKILHTIAYAALGCSFSFWFKPALWKKFPIRIALVVFLLTVLYGVSDEFHQSFTPGRFVSGYDLIADGIGAILAIVAYRYYLKVVFFKSPKDDFSLRVIPVCLNTVSMIALVKS